MLDVIKHSGVRGQFAHWLPFPPVEVLAGKNPALPFCPPRHMGSKGVYEDFLHQKKKKKKCNNPCLCSTDACRYFCLYHPTIRIQRLFWKKSCKKEKYVKNLKLINKYLKKSTRSRPITKVKQRWARIVLRWVTAWELRVVLAFFIFPIFYTLFK